HPRQQPGRRVTDPADLPAEKTTYALRDVASLAKTARRHGDWIGVYADRLLDTDLPWTKMRQGYPPLGPGRRGWARPGRTARPADPAARRARALDAATATKTASTLDRATETPPPPPRPPVAATARFARDPAEYRATQLTLLPGGKESPR